MAERPVGVTDEVSGSGIAQFRTRERSVGGETVVEQYLIPLVDRVPSYRGMVSTFRSLGGTAPLHHLSFFNKATSGVLVAVTSLFLRTDRSVSSATPRVSGLSLITTAPTTGTVLTPVPFDTALSHSSLVEARGLASADDTNGTLTATAGTYGWRTQVTRFHEAAGAGQRLMEDKPHIPLPSRENPIVLAEGEGILVTSIDTGPNTLHHILALTFEEYLL